MSEPSDSHAVHPLHGFRSWLKVLVGTGVAAVVVVPLFAGAMSPPKGQYYGLVRAESQGRVAVPGVLQDFYIALFDDGTFRMEVVDGGTLVKSTGTYQRYERTLSLMIKSCQLNGFEIVDSPILSSELRAKLKRNLLANQPLWAEEYSWDTSGTLVTMRPKSGTINVEGAGARVLGQNASFQLRLAEGTSIVAGMAKRSAEFWPRTESIVLVKQLATANLMYAGDYDDMLAPPRRWGQSLKPYFGLKSELYQSLSLWPSYNLDIFAFERSPSTNGRDKLKPGWSRKLLGGSILDICRHSEGFVNPSTAVLFVQTRNRLLDHTLSGVELPARGPLQGKYVCGRVDGSAKVTSKADIDHR